MKAKKLMAMALAGTMMLSAVPAMAEDSTASDSGDKVHLTALFISHPLTKSVDDMQWLQEIEDKAGVDVEWEQIYSDWDQVKSTRFASGDIPDLLFNATSDSDYTTYDGLFMELTDLIDKDAPNVKAMFDEEPDTKVLAQTLEGKIYATPKFQGKWPDCNGVMFINKTWLDELGLDEYLPGAEGKIYAKMLEMKKKCGGEFKNFESFDRMKVEHMLRVMELRKRKLLRIKTVIRNVLLYLF